MSQRPPFRLRFPLRRDKAASRDARGSVDSSRAADVVIRKVSPELASDRQAMRRVRRDIDVLIDLRHTNLLSVIDFNASAREVTYEGVGGTTLARLLEADGPLDLAAALVVYDDCLAGLNALHGADVFHGGLSTESVVIETAGAVMLGDAGIASALVPPGEPAVAAAPADGQQPVRLHGSVAADLHAAATVFQSALTDSRPSSMVRRTRSRGRADRDGSIEASVPAGARELLRQAFDENVEARWSSAADCRRDLAAAADSFLGDGWRRIGRASLAAAATAQASDSSRAIAPFGALVIAGVAGGGEPPSGGGGGDRPFGRTPRRRRTVPISPVAAGTAAILLVAATLVIVRAVPSHSPPSGRVVAFAVGLPQPPPTTTLAPAPSSSGDVAGIITTAPPAPLRPPLLYNPGSSSANPTTNPTSNPTGGPTPRPTPRPTPPPTPTPPTPTPTPPTPTPTPPTPTPIPNGIITGTVTDISNVPIAGAQVTIVSCSCGPPAFTDSNGNYLLPGLADGTYTLTFSDPPHQSQTQPVTVSGGSGTLSVQLA